MLLKIFPSTFIVSDRPHAFRLFHDVAHRDKPNKHGLLDAMNSSEVFKKMVLVAKDFSAVYPQGI